MSPMEFRQGALTQEPQKFCIGIDLDAIVIALIQEWIAWHNDQAEDKHHIHIDKVTKYKIEHFAAPGIDMFKFFEDHSNYLNCPVLPGASEALSELKDFGHDLIISTASAGRTAHLKWDLVKKAAPWFNENNVMVGSRKERMHFDVFIDDAPKNIVKYRNMPWGKDAKILTISYPYNQDCRTLVNLMAQDHNNTSQAWGQICDYIRNYSNSYNQLQLQTAG